jgi:membrane-bound lytic murein transglycosylase B
MTRRVRRKPRAWTSALVAVVALGAVTAGAVPLARSVAQGSPEAPAIAAAPAIPVDPAAGVEAVGEERVDGAWVTRVAEATGIPARALAAYASADLVLAAEQPDCGIGWNTLAGVGNVESRHGSYGGATLSDDGWVAPRIVGPALDGDGFAEIGDTDGGRWDGDVEWDRAVGPMQFIPETWRHWGADGNGDGERNPNQLDDAALAAARYLCNSGPMVDPSQWRDALFTYNPLQQYVDDVAAHASEYARLAEPD